jgi:hypothetical protein
LEITHHDLKVPLPDEWWSEAGMDKFVRTSNAFHVARHDSRQKIFEVRIYDVGPVHRSEGVCIFNNSIDDGLTARERVVRILRGFMAGDAIPPVEIIGGDAKDLHRYKLVHGTHRLYCSIAAGFTHIPATSWQRV